MKYRKAKGRDAYHWCTNCSRWPTKDYDEYDKPPSGEQCNECKEKQKNNECTTKA